jgi:hypothetical protein
LKTTSTSTRAWLSISLLALSGLLVLSIWDITSNTHFGELDFMGYWSSTYLLNNGENPYSVELMTAIQQTVVRSTLDVTIMSWNPPILFVFLLPLVWIPFTAAKFVWLMINLTLVVSAGIMLTRSYLSSVSPRLKLFFLVFSIGFPAVIAGLYMGQVTFLVFWGLVLCITLIKKGQWFWAGAALIFTAVKPHLAVLSVLYLLLYMAKRRRWQGWIGLASAGITCLMILFLLRPGLLGDLQGETVVASVAWATSTIGGLISHLGISESARYLIILLLPLPFFLLKHSEVFPLELSVSLLTLLTIPTTVFGWSYDQTLLLIPIAQIFGWLSRSKYKFPIFAAIACAMAINYHQRLSVINDMYYVWVPLFWWVIFGVLWREISFMDKSHAYSKRQPFSDRSFKERV